MGRTDGWTTVSAATSFLKAPSGGAEAGRPVTAHTVLAPVLAGHGGPGGLAMPSTAVVPAQQDGTTVAADRLAG